MAESIDHSVERRTNPVEILPVIERKLDEVKKAIEPLPVVVAPIPQALKTNTTLTLVTTLISALTPILLALIAMFGSQQLTQIRSNTDGTLNRMNDLVESLQAQLEAKGGPEAPQTRKETQEGQEGK